MAPTAPGVASESIAHRATTTSSPSPIKHVIVVIQENRSVDNLFNGLPGADTVTSGLDSHGNTVALHAVPLVVQYDLSHRHKTWVADYNGGKMNGFNLEPFVRATNSPPVPSHPAYGIVNQSDVQPYFTMAETYAFADRMFQTNQGGSFPAHVYIASATGAVDSTGTYNVLENAYLPNGVSTGGCDASSSASAQLINPSTNDQTQFAFPCFDHTTPWDLLDNAHVSWRWYEPRLGAGLWFTPDAFRHIRYGTDYANVKTPNSAILTDIQNGALPSVSWVIPTGAESDHANLNDGSGPAWVSSIVNAVGQSSYWNSTAIFVVWDDWGGWYDHVAPTVYNYEELGFRVPLIAISPYARPHYVSHVQHEFGSLTHFLETTFNLPSLGYTDARADNLSDMFNYSQTPLTFTAIPAARVAPASLNDTTIPDND